MKTITIVGPTYLSVFNANAASYKPVARYRISNWEAMPLFDLSVGKTQILITDLVHSCTLEYYEAVVVYARVAGNVIHVQVFFNCEDGVFLLLYGVNKPLKVEGDWTHVLSTLNILPDQMRPDTAQ